MFVVLFAFVVSWLYDCLLLVCLFVLEAGI